MRESKKLELNKEDGMKILKGLGIALGGAAITYGLEIIPNVDFGVAYTPMVVAISSILLNTIRKLLQGK